MKANVLRKDICCSLLIALSFTSCETTNQPPAAASAPEDAANMQRLVGDWEIIDGPSNDNFQSHIRTTFVRLVSQGNEMVWMTVWKSDDIGSNKLKSDTATFGKFKLTGRRLEGTWSFSALPDPRFSLRGIVNEDFKSIQIQQRWPGRLDSGGRFPDEIDNLTLQRLR
jgi:hypothetical protein